MKYKELLSDIIALKLRETAFSNASKNISTWKFYEAVSENLKYVRNEYKKQTEGLNLSVEEKNNINNTLLGSEIIYPVPFLDLNIEDFNDCKYPLNQALWLNGAELSVIEKYLNTYNKEQSN